MRPSREALAAKAKAFRALHLSVTAADRGRGALVYARCYNSNGTDPKLNPTRTTGS
jgi:hypothetical protein